MTYNIDVKKVDIENTFLPNFRNKFFSISGLITILSHGFCPIDAIPEDVRDKVEIILDERTVEDNSTSKDTSEEMKWVFLHKKILEARACLKHL